VGHGPIAAEALEATVRRFKKAVIERALGGELTHNLGYPAGGAKPDDTTHHRNGTSEKTVLTDDGPLTIDIPRDRESSVAPRLVAKHERRCTGFDDNIIALLCFQRGPWRTRFPTVVASWWRAWATWFPFFCVSAGDSSGDLPTNALESLNARIGKIIKTRGHFPNDDAATKLIWLALRNISAAWSRSSPASRAGDESICHPLRRTLSRTAAVVNAARLIGREPKSIEP
jgi:transposase-like protein